MRPIFCPVCNSPYSLYVHDVIGKRTGRRIPQHHCMDCKSFFNISGYKEDEQTLKEDLTYLINKQDHIAAIQNQLFHEISARTQGVNRVLEIGAGSGLFLKAATYNGIEAIGYDLNYHAAKYAREVIGVNVIASQLSEQEPIGKFDLICAIGVFEHVEQPRELMKLLLNFIETDGYLYVNVPFVDREHWKYLMRIEESPAEKSPPDPFYDNDVHIIHFSRQGLEQMGRSMGAKTADYFVSKDVSTKSPGGAYPGMLFRFI